MTVFRTIVLALVAVSVMPGSVLTAGTPSIRVMPRVNTKDAEVRKVLTAWVDSLDSWRGMQFVAAGPERDAPWQPGSPRQVVSDWFGQSNDVLNTFAPTILSIEKGTSIVGAEEADAWTVRTMFSTIEEGTQNIIPLGILRTTFYEGPAGTLVVEHPMSSATRSWTTTAIGAISYVMPPGAELDEGRARDANRFMRSTAAQFGVDLPENVTMYLASDRDQMCELFGLEYYAFPPTGMAFPESAMILTSMGDPFYSHELVHIVVRDLEHSAHAVVREGVATWLGGSANVDLETMLRSFLRDKGSAGLPTLEQLFDEQHIDQEVQYVMSAVVCHAINARKGINGIKHLMSATSSTDAVKAAQDLLGVAEQENGNSLEPFIREVLNNN